MGKIIVNNLDEFLILVKNSDFRISKNIVTSILDNLKTTKKTISVLDVEVIEDGETYNVEVDKKHFVQTLEKNLLLYIKEELYEECKDIVEAINTLKNNE